MAQQCLRLRATPLPLESATRGVLVVAPHPDDETLGCGRLIADLRRRGVRVDIIWLTDGESSPAGFPGGASRLAATRRAEACAAAQVLGVPEACLHHLGAPDGRLPHLPAGGRAAVVTALTHLIDTFQPGAVLVTSDLDGSTEHAAAHAITVDALAAAEGHPLLLSYLVWAHWKVRELLAVCRGASPVHFATATAAAVALRTQAIVVHATQTAPQPPRGVPLLTAPFLACFPRSGEFFLKN